MINMPLICLLVTPSKSKEKKFCPNLGKIWAKMVFLIKKISQNFALRDLLNCCYHIFFFLVGREGIEPSTY